jgi:hypothetical protein
MLEQKGPAAGGAAVEAGIRFADERRPDITIASNAATRARRGEPSQQSQQRPRTIALVARRPLIKGALRGFVTVRLSIGLEIVDCPVLASNGKTWANLPAKPVLDRDGRQKNDVNGKPAYTAILQWRERELSDRFSEVVIDAIRRMHPGALDGAGS